MGVESNTSASYKMILLQIYPIGSIYESINDNDPNEFIGGTWARLGEGRMLISVKEYESYVSEYSSNLTVTLDEETWNSAVTDLHATTYEFVYDGSNWNSTFDNFDPQSYGITITGTPVSGNTFKITVVNIYPIGKEGGESNHTLTIQEIPAHTHTVGLNPFYPKQGGMGRTSTSGINYKDSGESVALGESGSSQPHENMPPYIVYYAWERIS